jgi:hypothetical protein
MEKSQFLLVPALVLVLVLVFVLVFVFLFSVWSCLVLSSMILCCNLCQRMTLRGAAGDFPIGVALTEK